MNIRTENLSKRFNYEWIFRNATLDLKAGNRYAVIGPNGSGKSTFLQIITGMIPQTAGTVQYTGSNGNSIAGQDIYRYLTFCSPYMDLIDEFTLTEMVDFHSKMKPLRDNQTSKDIIHRMYLEKAAHKAVGDFSSGMKQRLKLGLALYTNSDFVVLDEPGSNLDAQAFDWYYREMMAIPSETLVLIGSNNSAEYPPETQLIDIRKFKGNSAGTILA